MFADRLVDEADCETFVNLLSDKLGTMFDLTYHNLCHNKQPPIFGTSFAICKTKGDLGTVATAKHE